MDVHERWHPAPAATVTRVLQALGAEPLTMDDGGVRAARRAPSAGHDVWIVRSGEKVEAGGRFRLVREDGGEETGSGPLPVDLPLGYHELELLDEERSVRLVVSPGRCPHPPRAWGWSAQLYATRSSRSWGVGDLGDLASLTRWSGLIGAGAVLVNPLHATGPTGPQEASPYFPASRVFRNPIYLNMADVDGVLGLPGLTDVVRRGEELNAGETIDRDAVWSLKLGVLEQAFRRWSVHQAPGARAAFNSYREEQGEPLVAWSAWCVACEAVGPDRSTWPAALTADTLVAATARDAELARRAEMHAWLQWQLDRQLEKAGSQGPALITDLAIGCDPGGFDTWLWPDAFMTGMRVGAPPDVFAPDGQDWGLPPLDPWALRRLSFEPFVRVVRAGLRHAGGLRMDHVMGLFRLFVVPVGDSAADGCYLRYPSSELLDILALEAHRSGAFVVGEDLGTVEPDVREELARRQVLGTKLLWFEDDKPAAWPVAALAAVSTHDLPTVAGAWTGEDVADQEASGAAVASGAVDALADKLAGWARLDRSATAAGAVAAAHCLLAEAPCALVLATLEDVAGQVRRPNLPGTVAAQRPNWSIPLPVTLEELQELDLTAAAVEAMRRRPEPPAPEPNDVPA